MTIFQISLEVFLLFILLAALCVGIHLGRSLKALRRDRAELDAMVLQLRRYSEEAQNGINQLQKSSEGVGRALAKTVEAGQVLKQDLVALCERSEVLAEQLEGGVFQRRGPDVSAAPAVRSPAPRARGNVRAVAEPEAVGGGLGKSAAERELLRALRQKQG